jgi:hypothetical protein
MYIIHSKEAHVIDQISDVAIMAFHHELYKEMTNGCAEGEVADE